MKWIGVHAIYDTYRADLIDKAPSKQPAISQVYYPIKFLKRSLTQCVNDIAPTSQPILKGVSVRRDEQTILQDVNLELQPGDMVYITGPVGCGKSSLLELIYGDGST